MSYKILNGNELLIQGAMEAGFELYTGYPGSPLADFFNILFESREELAQKGIKVVLANSEANAAAMASGAKLAGQNVLVAMKSMGLHVASDALSVGNFANPGPSGVVVAVGDDPWSISTSTPADSRYLFKHLHMPFLEPATPQELKDWIKHALWLSQQSSVYAGLLLTTNLAEGGGRVEVGEFKEVNKELKTLDPSTFNLSSNVMVPPNSLLADKEMISNRFPKVIKALRELNLDQEFGNDSSKIGIVSAGAVFETLKQVLEDSDLINEVSLYKVGCSYPLVEDRLLPFLKSKEAIIVVEEKRGFLEGEIKTLLASHELSLKVIGKKFSETVEGFSAWGGLSYDEVYKKLNLALDVLAFKKADCQEQVANLNIEVAKRLPTFCPGCPHRETLSIMKDVRSVLKDKNINLISHGDVGCYSLSFLEPFKEMHDLSAMGQGGALGAGTDIFTTNPSVVLMGDSTFFHSGLTAISNSVQLGHNITYILLDNDNTAMTGHQVTPRTGTSVDGSARPRQNMLDVVKTLRVSEALEVNPSDRYFYKNLLTDMVLREGVKVIVSNKECGLTFHGRKKREERELFKNGTQKKREFYQINTLACEDCRECVEMTGCPGLSQTFDAYGPKVMIDPQICVSDSYCTKIKACPSFELVEVSDYHPTKYKEANSIEMKEVALPEMRKDLAHIADNNPFRAIVIGVGGSGVTTISRVLAEASTHMGGRDDLDFKFVDQKGLAQRNGSVMSHVSIYPKSKSHGPMIPLKKADVVLSPDLLEGARAVEYLSSEGILICDSEYQIPLSILLDRGIEKDVLSEEMLRAQLQEKLGERVILAPMKKLSQHFLGRPVYASAMVLGLAFQKGLLPFNLSDLEGAFKRATPRAEFENNWKAFQMGRMYIESPIEIEEKENSSRELIIESLKMVRYPWQSENKFEILFSAYESLFKEKFSEIDEEHLRRYLHDIIVFDQGKHLASFYQTSLELKKIY
ncbi:MAG: 2-oxoacid:acceptor oxidoreductase family protein, partial [Bacteriovoracaceae bacterium]